MSDLTQGSARAAFGSVALFKRSFEIASRMMGVLLLCLLMTYVLPWFFGIALFGFGNVDPLNGPDLGSIASRQDPTRAWVLFGLHSLVSFYISCVTFGVIAQLVHDAEQGEPRNAVRALAVALRRSPALLLVTLLIGVAFGIVFAVGSALAYVIGVSIPLFTAIAVAGCFAYALFAGSLPAVVLEGRWLSAFTRSFRLSRRQVVPIAGTLFMVLLVAGLVYGLIMAMALYVETFGMIGIALGVIIGVPALAIVFGAFSGVHVLIFLRLREIEERAVTAATVDVFT